MTELAALFIDLSVPVLGLLFGYTVAGWSYGFGPVIWVRRAAGRSRARRDDSGRRMLVERVRRLLPQANDGNTVFSIEAVRSTRGGSQFKVTTEVYHYHVFVAEMGQLWIIPFFFDPRAKTYELGNPVSLTRDLIRDVELTGRKKQTVTFWLKQEVGLDKVVMVLEPFQFQKNKWHPFDFFQEEACERALSAAESMAISCDKLSEDLEAGRVKDECVNYSIAAGFCGFLGMGTASGGFLVPTLVLFAVGLILIAVILAKGQVPKGSILVLLLEAAGAWMFLR